jgi:hypothetical protein
MNSILLFVSTFVLVFSLGLQSLMVNRGHFAGAFLNSLLISGAQLLLLKLGPDAAGAEIAGYIFGGPFGIVAAMYVFGRWSKIKKETS